MVKIELEYWGSCSDDEVCSCVHNYWTCTCGHLNVCYDETFYNDSYPGYYEKERKLFGKCESCKLDVEFEKV